MVPGTPQTPISTYVGRPQVRWSSGLISWVCSVGYYSLIWSVGMDLGQVGFVYKLACGLQILTRVENLNQPKVKCSDKSRVGWEWDIDLKAQV